MIRSHFTRLLCIGVILTGTDQLLSRKTVLAAPAPASNRTKILGVWEGRKSNDGITYEFAKDGKLKITAKVGDRNIKIEGAYKVEGNKLILTIKAPDEKDGQLTGTWTIIELTDKELIIKHQTGITDEFKKKK